MFLNLKVVDLVEKSEKIEIELTQILSNMIDFDQKLSILTSSFLVNYFRVYPVKKSFLTEADTGIQKNLDFGCGFGFLNPKSKLNQNIQKTKKPHSKPNHKIKKTKNQIQNQS